MVKTNELVVTAKSLLGKVVEVYMPNDGIESGDECSKCGQYLSAFRRVFVADYGRYCGVRCAEEHADFLAAEMNRCHREDAS